MIKYAKALAACLLLTVASGCTSIYHIPPGSPETDNKPISTSSPYNVPQQNK